MAHVSEVGLKLIQKFEGCRLTAYDDGTGVWTIGWGHTGVVDGIPVVPGMEITQWKADLLLQYDLVRFEAAVEHDLSHSATPGQFDAMVALAFNIGINAFMRSTVLKEFNAGNLLTAAAAFMMWIRPVEVMEGLARRRAAEIVRFMS